MIEILTSSVNILTGAGFDTMPISINGREALAFEDAMVLGFLFTYQEPNDLIEAWNRDSSRAITDNQFGLRRAGQKAWNAYCVFLATGNSTYVNLAALAAIEENLEGTRKIARSDIGSLADLRAALLPLLPLQSAPKLDAVNIEEEIRQRATELQPRAIDAFLSNAEESVVIQVLEETP